jgi:hypothetical protein
MNIHLVWVLYNLRELKRAGVAATRAHYRYPLLDRLDLRLLLEFEEIWSVRRARARLKSLALDRDGKDRQ